MIKLPNGTKVHSGFALLPKRFVAITLFGRIFSNLKGKALSEYIESPQGKRTLNHERIHILQAKSLRMRWLTFYTLYIYYWLWGIFRYGLKQSYYEIPFEREAYANDGDFSYSESRWRSYRG